MVFKRRLSLSIEQLEPRRTLDAESPTFNIDFQPSAAPPVRLHRVAALGDSMTLESTGSYVQFLREQFAPSAFEADTFAGSGWKVETMRQVWETEVRDAGFDTLIVLAGVTNLTSSTANADEIFANLKSIYDDAMARNINVIAITACPWADYRKWTAERQLETYRFNALLTAYAQEHSQLMHLINTYDAFGMTDDPTRLSPRLGIGDGVHFSDVGDRRLAELVTPILAGLMVGQTISQSAMLSFSEPVTEVVASQVTVKQGALSRDFQLVPINSQQYRIDFQLGEQELIDLSIGLDAATIADLAGNALVSQPPRSFLVDYQSPSADFTLDQNVISAVSVSEVTITFEEDIRGLSTANFQLLKDRLPVDLSGARLDAIDARTYRLRLAGAAALDGNYQLNFLPAATVTDLNLNSTWRGSSIAWVTLAQAPQIDASTINLFSTRGRDTLEIVVAFDRIEWVIGGVSTFFDSQGITKINVATGAGIDYVSMRVLPGSPAVTVSAVSPDGIDTAFVYDSPDNDQWEAGPVSSTLRSASFQLSAVGFASVSAYSRGGQDQATLFDSTGSDKMDSQGWVTSLKGTGFNNAAFGFPQVIGQAGSGGSDLTDFFDSPGDDVALVTPTQATLTVPGFSTTARNFGRVNIRATQGNDTASLVGSTAAETYVGQSASSFWSGAGFTRYLYGFDEVQVSGGGGSDRATLNDSPSYDRLEANTRTATLIMPTVRLTTIDIPRTNVYSRGGHDTAVFNGRPISETFVGQPTFSSLSAGGYAVYAYAFESVSALGNGGNDIATFFDSTGDDVYESNPTTARLSGPGYSVEASDYRRFSAYARSGNDLARMASGPTLETLTGQATSSSIIGSNNSNFAYGFDRVIATGDANDTASLYDTSGDDAFEATGSSARIWGTTYDNSVTGFGRVNAFARLGNDSATLTGTTAAESFTGRPSASSMIGAGFANYVYAFDKVTARGGGGTDVAVLYDSTGNDQFVGSPTSATLGGPGYALVVENFPRVSAYASTGQDTAQLRGSTQSDNYVGRPEYTLLKNSLYTLLAYRFDAVNVDGFGGNDTATFFDSIGDDQVVTGFRSGAISGTVSGVNYLNSVSNFAKLTFSASGGNDIATINSTPGDDTFSSEGSAASLTTTGLSLSLSGFDTLTLAPTTEGIDRALLKPLTYQLNIGAGWLVP